MPTWIAAIRGNSEETLDEHQRAAINPIPRQALELEIAATRAMRVA